MIDRDKVIKGLECLTQRKEPTVNPCRDCGYINRPNFAICVKDVASDALVLLKEQESVIEALKSDLDETFAMLGDQPEIVRCKDCKHCEYPSAEKEWCKKGHLHGNAENWFCADAERKEGL